MIIGPPILLYSSGTVNSNKTLGIATECNMSEKSTGSEVLEDDEKIDASSGCLATVNSNKTLGIATEVNEAEYNTSEKSTDSEVLEDDEKIDASSGFD
jgi:hypothetical protein